MLAWDRARGDDDRCWRRAIPGASSRAHSFVSRRAFALAIFGIAAAICGGSPAGAADPMLALAFFAADTDHDGLLTKPEIARDTAAAFAALDADMDGVLTRGELAPHDGARFAQIDLDADGRLTFVEVVTAKFEDLSAIDRDRDGRLSTDEIQAFTPHRWEAGR
jgi:hypothetical protein